MNRFLLIACFVSFISVLSGQGTDYWQVLNTGETLSTVHRFRGDSLYKLGKVRDAIREYRLQDAGKYQICKYEKAKAFARDLQYDSAFLYIGLNMQYDHYSNPGSDPAFREMRDDPRWDPLLNRYIDSLNDDEPGTIKDIPLTKLLWKMYADDQAYYYEIQILNPDMHDSSAIIQTFWALKENLNEENHRLLDSIIAKKGWPKISEVGKDASQGAFMVVQHMPSGKIGLYLPLIKARCEENEADWSDYAHVYDRMCFYEKKPQRYGTQLDFDKKTGQLIFYPIEDPANVNKRRAEIGLETIEKYAELVGYLYGSPVQQLNQDSK